MHPYLVEVMRERGSCASFCCQRGAEVHGLIGDVKAQHPDWTAINVYAGGVKLFSLDCCVLDQPYQG
jgi:hypothetical protein